MVASCSDGDSLEIRCLTDLGLERRVVVQREVLLELGGLHQGGQVTVLQADDSFDRIHVSRNLLMRRCFVTLLVRC